PDCSRHSRLAPEKLSIIESIPKPIRAMLPAMTPALILTSASVRFQPSVKYSKRRPFRISVARRAFWIRAFGIAESVGIRSATEQADSKSNEHKAFQPG